MYLAYDTPHAALQLPTTPYPDGKGIKGGLEWLGAPGKMINTAKEQLIVIVIPFIPTKV